MATGMPTWPAVRMRVARELGERVYDAEPLVPTRQSAMTWAARAQRTGPIVVKLRHGDRAEEKTRWCATHLPVLGARGYPVPAILWHGMIREQWHLTVQNRLPGRPLYPLGRRRPGLRGGRSAVCAAAALAPAGLGTATAASRLRTQRP
jgi:hypothetical protein